MTLHGWLHILGFGRLCWYVVWCYAWYKHVHISIIVFFCHILLSNLYVICLYYYLWTSSLCRSTKSDHIKINLVHKLHMIKVLTLFNTQSFMTLYRLHIFYACINRQHKNIGYPFNLDMFIQLFYKVSNLYTLDWIWLEVCPFNHMYSFISCSFLMQSWTMVQREITTTTREASIKQR